MKRTAKLFSALALTATLTGCIDEAPPAANGDRQHRSEIAPPANVLSGSQKEQAIATWQANSFYDAANIKDVGMGPLRYAAITLLSPKRDLFACSKFTAKNKFGTYTPPQYWFAPIYDNSRGVYVGFPKRQGEHETGPVYWVLDLTDNRTKIGERSAQN